MACQGPLPDPPRQAGTASANPIAIPKPPPTLASAIRTAVDLGPAGRATVVAVSLKKKVSHQGELDALLGEGKMISPADYTARFGPDPVLVQHALSYLNAAGLRASWQPPSSLIAADGAAPAAAALLKVDFESYRLPSGTTFYASLDQPLLPPALASVTENVSGLDNYRRSRGFAVRPGGLVPTDVLAYYNLKPLRDAGLDGKGQTIVLPEIDDLPKHTDLNKFASKFDLPS